MAEKHTTLTQLRLSALRTKSEVLALLDDAFEGVRVGTTITLPAASWVSGEQTVQNAFFLADDAHSYFVCPDADCVSASIGTGLRADNVTTDGEMTFRCDHTPQSNLTINILRLEVEI